MSEQQKYRVSFEFVNPISHPQAYRGERPCIRVDEVPEKWWHRVERETYDLADAQTQYDGVRYQIAVGHLMRNPVLEKATVSWEIVEDAARQRAGGSTSVVPEERE